jgi:asparagine synthase (glutamine-hydrolysing)
MLFGWLSADRTDAETTATVLASMAAALRVSPDEQATLSPLGGCGVGVIERPSVGGTVSAEPARRPDGVCLWMTGEAFDWPSQGGLTSVAESVTLEFRQRLLEALMRRGPDAVRDLDGEYQIALWTPQRRQLLLLNDRFGALPMYIGTGTRGTAFAGGVRGVLIAPGIAAEPDVDAIREAVSFGGYRLGSRTNVRAVRMVAPASAVTVSDGAITPTRYWSWSDLRVENATDERALLEETRAAWTQAIARRLSGARRPGLTLSGGLDSRAILAEAARQTPSLTALTYGVADSDDVRIARRAARAVDATWQMCPLYEDGWLDRRTDRIQQTDGLMDLVDLMHTEALDAMPQAFDVHLSGYIGDAVIGSTLWFGDRAEDFLATMPYYGGDLAMPYAEALATAETLMRATPGPPRFAPYEHKLPQSTNRITAAARPFATVRRPFVDYRLFDVCQRLPSDWRAAHRWRERWLVSTYPECFARIPNQQTGVPPGASRARWHVTRAARYAWRRGLQTLRAAGVPVTVPQRSYHPDERYWSEPQSRAAIEAVILRNGSVSCDVFGRTRVTDVVRRFFAASDAPVQVIGAMYVFERYHQTLGASLAAARDQVPHHVC